MNDSQVKWKRTTCKQVKVIEEEVIVPAVKEDPIFKLKKTDVNDKYKMGPLGLKMN